MISNRKITDSDISTNGVISAPDTLTGTASENKQVFDKLIKNTVKGDFNGLIDDLSASTGAAEIGADTEGLTGDTVQEQLTEMKADLDTKAIADTDAVEDNFCMFDDEGNPVDSGHKHADYVTKESGKGLSTNDYDNIEKQKVADAYSVRHSHSNKALLDTYNQTEENLADAVTKKHSHSNKALLDTYDQTNSDIATAVSNAHTHSNKAALDTITAEKISNWETVTGKENSSNKVTSMTSESTDTQYPSAKAVYDAIASSGASAVRSVNGKVGVVVIDKSDVGLGSVDNTADVDKPISTLTQTALDGKEDAGSVSAHDASASAHSTLFAGKVNTSDIADNLTTDDSAKVLSAKQGKVLGGYVGDLGNAIGTRGWNQLVVNGNFADTSWWNRNLPSATFTASNNIGVITPSNTGDNYIYKSLDDIPANHKLFVRVDAYALAINLNIGYLFLGTVNDRINIISSVASQWERHEAIGTMTSSTGVKQLRLASGGGTQEIKFRNVNLIDLTAMGLDSINTVDEFKALFPNDYYPYHNNTNSMADLNYVVTSTWT